MNTDIQKEYELSIRVPVDQYCWALISFTTSYYRYQSFIKEYFERKGDEK